MATHWTRNSVKGKNSFVVSPYGYFKLIVRETLEKSWFSGNVAYCHGFSAKFLFHRLRWDLFQTPADMLIFSRAASSNNAVHDNKLKQDSLRRKARVIYDQSKLSRLRFAANILDL